MTNQPLDPTDGPPDDHGKCICPDEPCGEGPCVSLTGKDAELAALRASGAGTRRLEEEVTLCQITHEEATAGVCLIHAGDACLRQYAPVSGTGTRQEEPSDEQCRKWALRQVEERGTGDVRSCGHVGFEEGCSQCWFEIGKRSGHVEAGAYYTHAEAMQSSAVPPTEELDRMDMEGLPDD